MIGHPLKPQSRSFRRWLDALFTTLGVGQGLVDDLVELAGVEDFDERGASGLAGDDPDGWGVVDADALAQGFVGLDLSVVGALGVYGEGQRTYFVVVGEFFGELAQDFEGGDGGLVGEDLVAVIVAELFGLGVEEAGVDGGLGAPGVVREREVVANPRNLVLIGGLAKERVFVAADRALHVFEFDDGHARPGRRLEG